MSLRQGQIDKKILLNMFCELLPRTNANKTATLAKMVSIRLEESLKSYSHDIKLAQESLGARKNDIRLLNRLNKNV